jgi:Methyltransferase domain
MNEPRRLPRTQTVDRVRFLTDMARWRSVIHVGFSDREAVEQFGGRWLHGELAAVARSLIGLDIDEGGVSEARRRGFEVYPVDSTDSAAIEALDIEPAEVVIAGEIIEHIDAPGALLEALKLLVTKGGRLIITTPNATSLLNCLAAFANYELSNPDHVTLFSWYTLTNLLDNHGWRVEKSATYSWPLLAEGEWSFEHRVGRTLARLQRLLALRWPFVDHGLIVVANR